MNSDAADRSSDDRAGDDVATPDAPAIDADAIEWRSVGGGVEIASVHYSTPGGSRPLHLRVHRGPNRSLRRPMILDLHGGAWTHFEPSVDDLWCRGLASRGYVVASAEMRLSGDAPWPAAFDDAVAAARWLRRNGATLGGNTERLAVMGGSTGGHLAAMVGLVAPADAAVDAVVALWPIVDVPGRWDLVRHPPVGRFTRVAVDRMSRRAPAPGEERPVARRSATHGPAERLAALAHLQRRRPRLGHAIGWLLQRLNASVPRAAIPRALLYRQLADAHVATFQRAYGTGGPEGASPLHILRAGEHLRCPPTLVVHAERDVNTTREMSSAFVDAMVAVGGSATLVVADGLGHSYGNIASRPADELIATIDSFLVSTDPEPIGP